VALERGVEYYGDGRRFGVELTYVKQGDPKGVAHAVQLCEDFIGGEPFVVYLGDNVLKGGLPALRTPFRIPSSILWFCCAG